MNKTRPTLKAAKPYLSLNCHVLNEINYLHVMIRVKVKNGNYCYYLFFSICDLGLKKYCIVNYFLKTIFVILECKSYLLINVLKCVTGDAYCYPSDAK